MCRVVFILFIILFFFVQLGISALTGNYQMEMFSCFAKLPCWTLRVDHTASSIAEERSEPAKPIRCNI